MFPDAVAADRMREEQRRAWSAATPGWQPPDAASLASPDPISEQLLALAQIAPGQRVLDLSCGAGNPALLIARRVGASGFVLGLDLTEAMVRAVAASARQQGFTNAEFRAIAAEIDLGVPDGDFDAAICRHGLMFMPEPLGALRALHAALQPGGRIAVSTWAGLERSPSFGVFVDALVRHINLTPAAVGELTRPFTALPEPELLVDLLNEAGFVEVEVSLVEQWHEAESAAAHWAHTTACVPSMRALLAAQPEAVREAIRDDALAILRAQFGEGPVRLLATALVVGGVKPV